MWGRAALIKANNSVIQAEVRRDLAHTHTHTHAHAHINIHIHAHTHTCVDKLESLAMLAIQVLNWLTLHGPC